MDGKKQVRICENHLSELYEALHSRDVERIERIERIERVLSPSEQCVACAYVFKTQGTAREALEHYLKQEGFSIDSVYNKTFSDHLAYWSLRIILFFSIFVMTLSIEKILRQFFIRANTFGILSVTIIEFIGIALVSLFTFLVIDDALFD